MVLFDEARSAFINHFKEVQRLKIQLDQYTDLTEENKKTIEQVLPKEELYAFRGVYLETAQHLKEQQRKRDDQGSPEVQQLDFEFVLLERQLALGDRVTSVPPLPLTKSRKNRKKSCICGNFP